MAIDERMNETEALIKDLCREYGIRDDGCTLSATWGGMTRLRLVGLSAHQLREVLDIVLGGENERDPPQQ